MKTNNKARTDWDLNDAYPESELFLDFIDDDEVVPAEEIRQRVTSVLEQYTLEEIFEENDLTDEEAVGVLYENGFIGLPELIEYEEDEEISDLQDEE